MSGGSSDREAVARMVQEALRRAPFNLRDLAEEMEGSYGTIREWSRGARVPTDESVERIAASLDRRARMLQQFAARLREEIARRGKR
jgi:transcriptional regulator with XRE-family HTH domain